MLGLATVLIQSDSGGMPVSICINPFPLNLYFHIDCAFMILMMKLFCRDVVLQDFLFIQKTLECFTKLFIKHLIFTPCMDHIKLIFLFCIDKSSSKCLSSYCTYFPQTVTIYGCGGLLWREISTFTILMSNSKKHGKTLACTPALPLQRA